MPIKYSRNQAVLRDTVSGDEAEALLEWLQKKPSAKVDLAECSHVHPANLQVLLAAGTRVATWPKDLAFGAWLKTILRSE